MLLIDTNPSSLPYTLTQLDLLCIDWFLFATINGSVINLISSTVLKRPNQIHSRFLHYLILTVRNNIFIFTLKLLCYRHLNFYLTTFLFPWKTWKEDIQNRQIYPNINKNYHIIRNTWKLSQSFCWMNQLIKSS